MRISDWSSDVCSSDLRGRQPRACRSAGGYRLGGGRGDPRRGRGGDVRYRDRRLQDRDSRAAPARRWIGNEPIWLADRIGGRRRAGAHRESVVSGKSVSLRVDLGGRPFIKKKTKILLVYYL